MADLQVGNVIKLSGFVTTLKFVLGKSAGELDDILGYSSGTLVQGYWLCRLVEPIQVGCFALRGMTNCSGGKSKGSSKTIHSSLRDNLRGNPVDQQSWKNTLGQSADRLNLQGVNRTCKVIPVQRPDAYPAGLGVPQWEILKGFERKFIVEAQVQPPQKVFRKPDDTLYAAAAIQGY